jgi:hypothetical protein
MTRRSNDADLSSYFLLASCDCSSWCNDSKAVSSYELSSKTRKWIKTSLGIDGIWLQLSNIWNKILSYFCIDVARLSELRFISMPSA